MGRHDAAATEEPQEVRKKNRHAGLSPALHALHGGIRSGDVLLDLLLRRSLPGGGRNDPHPVLGHVLRDDGDTHGPAGTGIGGRHRRPAVGGAITAIVVFPLLAWPGTRPVEKFISHKPFSRTPGKSHTENLHADERKSDRLRPKPRLRHARKPAPADKKNSRGDLRRPGRPSGKSAYLTALTIAWNAFGSFMARSARTLRFRAIPLALSLPMNCE